MQDKGNNQQPSSSVALQQANLANLSAFLGNGAARPSVLAQTALSNPSATVQLQSNTIPTANITNLGSFCQNYFANEPKVEQEQNQDRSK